MVKKVKIQVEEKITEKKESETQTTQSKGTSTTSTSEAKPKPTKINKSEGITSPTHEKYLNKIVFVSNEKSIAKKAEIEADFKSEFTLGDPIYFKFYLDKTIEQSLEHIDDGTSSFENGINLEFKFYINDVLIDNMNGQFQFGDIDREIREEWTTLRGAFKSVDNSVYIGKSQFEDLLRMNGDKFKIGKNKLKVEIYPITWSNYPKGEVIASGEITLNVKNSIINPNDPDVCLPQAKMKDDVLLKNIIKNLSGSNTGFKASLTNTRIISPTWSNTKNKYGTLMYRTIAICTGYKDENDNKCYKAFYIVEQEYEGTKFSNETYKPSTNIIDKEEIN